MPTQPKLSRVFCTFFTGTSSQTCLGWLGSVSPPGLRGPTQQLLSRFCWFLRDRASKPARSGSLRPPGWTLGFLRLPVSCPVLSPFLGCRPGWFLCRRVLCLPAWLACCGLLFGWLAAWFSGWFGCLGLRWDLVWGCGGLTRDRWLACCLILTYSCHMLLRSNLFYGALQMEGPRPGASLFFLQQAEPRLCMLFQESISLSLVIPRSCKPCLVAHKP